MKFNIHSLRGFLGLVQQLSGWGTEVSREVEFEILADEKHIVVNKDGKMLLKVDHED